VNHKLQERFETLKSSKLLPSPHGPALAVVQMTRMDNVSSAQLAHAIQVDPALVARLLKLANACRIPGARPILAIKEAVGILGLNTVRGLALGFSLMTDKRSRACRSFNYSAFWSRNLARAVAMQALAASSRLMQGDEAFTLGLLSHIGELGLASLFPEEYALLLEQAPPFGVDCLTLEQQSFEFDHADLTGELLADWGFPASLIGPVVHHEQPEAANFAAGSRAEFLLLTLVLASKIADVCLATKDQRRAMMVHLFLLGGKLSIGAEDLMTLCDGIVCDWSEWCRLLEVPSETLPPFAEWMNAPDAPSLKQDDGLPGRRVADGFRVLVVDDDRSIRNLLKALLTKAGYACSEAENGRQALELTLTEPPDLMIVDWMMPEMDGIELIRHLRKTESGRAIYILLLTGLDKEESLLEGFSAGADDFLSKPLKSSVLTARLLAGQRVVTLHREIRRDQTNLKSFATEFASLNQRLQEGYQRDVENQKRMELALHGGDLGMWDWHIPSGEMVLSKRWCSMVGYRTDEFKPHVESWRNLVHPDDRRAVNAALEHHLSAMIQAYECEFRMQHKDGHWVWILARGKVVELDAAGKALRVVGTHMEISKRKQMEDQVRQLAFFDALTQLPNRRLLNDRLSQAMAASKRSGCHSAVMFLDLDHFKQLNDSHGHAAGDLLLTEVAGRLKSCVRETDTVARFGGDEFVLIISELDVEKVASVTQATIIAEKVHMNLSAPYLLTISRQNEATTSIEHRCTASIGVVLFKNHEASQDDLLKWADVAMYEAKTSGRNSIRFYETG